MLKYLLQKEFLQIRRNSFMPKIIFITHGMTHITIMGKMKMIFGINELRRICRNSFCMRYFSVMPWDQ